MRRSNTQPDEWQDVWALLTDKAVVSLESKTLRQHRTRGWLQGHEGFWGKELGGFRGCVLSWLSDLVSEALHSFLSKTSHHLCIPAPHPAPRILAQLETQLSICSGKHKINFMVRSIKPVVQCYFCLLWVFDIFGCRTTYFVPFGNLSYNAMVLMCPFT